jgi:MFS family permease
MINVLITDLIPLKQRAQYFGLISMAWALGTLSGTLLGSVLAEKATWRWIFWILIPFNILSMLIVLLFLRIRRKDEVRDKLSQIDYFGALLFAASTTSFLLGITFGGTQYPWKSAQTIVPLILGVLGIAGFAFWEVHGTSHPIIPMRIFSTVTAAQGYLSIAVLGMIMWAVIYYLPLYYEGVLGYSFIISSVALLPLTATMTPAAAVIGRLITKTGRYLRCLWLSWLMNILGIGLALILWEHTTVPQWVFIGMVGGLGTGLLLSTTQIAVQASTQDSDLAIAAAMVAEIRTYGQAVGLAIFGAVFTNVARRSLIDSPVIGDEVADELSNNVYILVHTIKDSPNGPQKEALIRAMALGNRAVWITALPIAVVAGVFSLWAKEYSLDRALASQHVVQEKKSTNDTERLSVTGEELT